MSLKKMVVLAGIAIITLTAAQIVFAQDSAATPDSVLITNQTASKEGEIQWAWGEVTDLDAQAKTITLKYLDYETDQEKDLVLAVDDKTTFENVKDFSELKLKDTLSIDYVSSPDNRNLAKNISLEKPEDTSSPVVESTAVAPATPAVNASGAAGDMSQAPVIQEPAAVSTPAAPAQESAATSAPVAMQESTPISTPAQESAATSAPVQESAPAAQAQ